METPHFCTCPVGKCSRHPANHNNGCSPCIEHNLKKGKIPACFFRMVDDDVSKVEDYTVEGFVEHFNAHSDDYRKKFGK